MITVHFYPENSFLYPFAKMISIIEIFHTLNQRNFSLKNFFKCGMFKHLQ